MATVGMRKPPLEMRHHFFPSVHIEADVNVAEKPPKVSDFGYDYKIDLQVGKILPGGLYPIALNIEACELEGKIKGYNLKVLAMGYIALDPSVPEDRKDNLVAVNGGSLLYGAAREYIYSLTMRGPFPPIYLPTISFMPMEPASTSSAPPPATTKSSRKKKQA